MRPYFEMLPAYVNNPQLGIIVLNNPMSHTAHICMKTAKKYAYGLAIERTQTILLPVSKYIDQLDRLRNDETYPVPADNLVFLTNSPDPLTLDRDVLYSILDKHPKRAKAYWFINVHVTDEPYTHEYSVETFGTDFLFRVRLDLGFKVNQRVNAYLRQIVGDPMASGELPPQHHT